MAVLPSPVRAGYPRASSKPSLPSPVTGAAGSPRACRRAAAGSDGLQQDWVRRQARERLPPDPRRSAWRGWLAPLLALQILACAPVDFTRPGSLGQPAPADLAGYFAEFCALSQLRQKRGMGAEILG